MCRNRVYRCFMCGLICVRVSGMSRLNRPGLERAPMNLWYACGTAKR